MRCPGASSPGRHSGALPAAAPDPISSRRSQSSPPRPVAGPAGGGGGGTRTGLPRAPDSTPSATSRLADRMQVAGLLSRDRAATSRREIRLVPTEAGRRLAEWVIVQRRSALSQMLARLSPQARDALATGLTELSADRKSVV